MAAHRTTGDAEGGLAAIDHALHLPDSRLWEAEHRRLRATFLARLGRPAGAVAAELDRAAGAARRQGARGLALRVARSRAELLPGS